MAAHSLKLKPETLAQSFTVAAVMVVLCRVGVFGRGVLLARTLDPVELGTWALMANAIQVLAFVVLLGVPSGLSRYVDRHRQEGSLRRFLTRAAGLSLAGAIAACLLAALCWQPLGRLLYSQAVSPALMSLTLAAIAATVIFSLLQGILHGLRLFRLDGCLELVRTTGFLAIAAVLVVGCQGGFLAVGWAYLITTLLATGAVGVYVCRGLREPQPPAGPAGDNALGQSTRLLFIYGLGAWSAGSLQAMWRCLDRYMLLHLSGGSPEGTLEQIGGYFIASKLGQPISVLGGMLAIVLLPHAVRRWENHRRQEVGEMIRLTAKLAVLGMTLMGATLVALKSFTLAIVVGYVPESSSIVFAPVMVTIIAVALHHVVRTYLLCRQRVWLISGVWLACLVLNALLNAYLIPRYQLYGAAVATMLSAWLGVFSVLVLSARHGLHIDRGTWLVSILPVTLLLPPATMIASLALLGWIMLRWDLLFSPTEKDRVHDWVAGRLGKRFAVGQA